MSTCMCTRKLGQAQTPFNCMLVHEEACRAEGPKDIRVCSRKLDHGRRPLKFPGKPATQEARVIEILDCTRKPAGQEALRTPAGARGSWGRPRYLM